MTRRYAVYLAPFPQTLLWDFGCRVLGYDAETGRDVFAQITPAAWLLRGSANSPGSPGAMVSMPRSNRRCVSAEGRNEAELIAALRAFCAAREAFPSATAHASPGWGMMRIVRRSSHLWSRSRRPSLLPLERDAVIGFDGFSARRSMGQSARGAGRRR